MHCCIIVSIEALINATATFIYRMATHQFIQLVALDIRKLWKNSSEEGLM